MVDKYIPFTEEVRGVYGLKNVVIEYKKYYDSIILHFTTKQYKRIDNEKSATWKHFCELLEKYDYKAEFTGVYCIEVYEEE